MALFILRGNKMTNYILRIAKDEWIRLVFNRKAYYTAMRRRWEPDSKVVFVKKMDGGDSARI